MMTDSLEIFEQVYNTMTTEDLLCTNVTEIHYNSLPLDIYRNGSISSVSRNLSNSSDSSPEFSNNGDVKNEQSLFSVTKEDDLSNEELISRIELSGVILYDQYMDDIIFHKFVNDFYN